MLDPRVTANKGIDMAELDVGDVAPQFDLPRDGGGSLSLAAIRGKPVVLYFYPQDDTTSCTNEAIGFSQLKPEFEKAGAVVIGLSPDSVKKHDKFKAKYDLTLDLVADEERKAIEAYHLWVEKTMYGRKYMGVERCASRAMPKRCWRRCARCEAGPTQKLSAICWPPSLQPATRAAGIG